MTREKIQKILDNGSDEFFENFCEVLMNEINSDDECYDKKGRQLLKSALESDNPDSFFLSICGWSLESLINKAEIE